MSGKYGAQQRHIRKTYQRFSLDLRPELYSAFKDACDKNGENRTSVIKDFIIDYCSKAG